MKSIGIDIGTTTISVVVMDCHSYTVERKYTVKNGSFLPTGNSWVRIQDVPLILERVREVLEEILNASSDIAAIGLTGQMHGIIYVDKDGNAASPLYTWQDERGNLPDFDGRTLCVVLSEDYGVKAAKGYGMVTHLYHVKKGLVPAKAVSFCTIADYLGMTLTGRSRPLIHISQAAGMGLYDPVAKDFRRDIAEATGMDLSMLPTVTSEITQLGVYRGIPVSVSLGDNQASYIGSVTDGENSVLVNIGTGAQISVLSTQRYEGSGIESRPLTQNCFLLVGATICGGDAFAALEHFFREYAAAAGAPDVPQFEVMKRLLEQQSDQTEAWKVRTTFAGTREDPNQTGAIEGIRVANFHPASIVRGVLNGMAQELYDLYVNIQTGTGISKSKLIASGNGVRRNGALQNILRERFGMPLEVEQNEEEAAFGAAVSGLIATGTFSLEQWLSI